MSQVKSIQIAKPAAKSASTKPAAKGKTDVKAAPAKTATPPAAKSGPVKKGDKSVNPAIQAMLDAALKKPEPAAKTPAKEAAPKAAKPKTELVKVTPRKVAKGKMVHVIAKDARPGSGRALFAHTHAALVVLGLIDASRPAVPRSSLLTLIGQRAVDHHTKDMNFETAPDSGIRLSSAGLTKFRAREVEGKFDGKLANAFISLFLDGEVKDTGVAKANIYQCAV